MGVKTPDVAITGGGLAGLASAWYLLERGCRVTIVDAGEVGRQASWAGGGILFPIYPWKYPAAVQWLAQQGRACYDAFTRDVDAVSGMDSENRHTGLHVLDSAEAPAARQWALENSERFQALDDAELARQQPGLKAGGSMYFPQAAQVRNPELCRSLRHALQTRGAEVIEHCPVHGVSIRNGRFAGFRHAAGTLNADYGVIASGAWSAQLLDDDDGSLPVTPVKGQMIALKAAPGLLHSVLLREGRYVIPRRDGLILVGSTVEKTGFDNHTNSETAQSLRDSAAGMLPALGDAPVERHWAGLRPATPDGLPIIGEHPRIHGLFVNTGHYRNGVLCAPSSAALLCQRMLERDDQTAEAFDPARFLSR